MGRFFLTLAVGLVIFLGAAWCFDLFVRSPDSTGKSTRHDTRPEVELGNVLYPVKPLPAEPILPDRITTADPISIPAHLVALDKPDFAPQVDGQILFIGEPVPDGVVAMAGVAPFAAEPFLSVDINQGGTKLSIIYRRLRDNDRIGARQMFGLLDPARAMNELAKASAKVKVAEREYEGSLMTYKEAVARYDSAKKLYDRGLVAAEEYREKKLAMDKFKTEYEGKHAAIDMAKAERDTAAINLDFHYLRNQIEAGFIKQIHKDRGNSVKNQEPILQLQNADKIEADGMLEVQFLSRLRPGMPVTVEPTYEDGPLRPLKSHRAEVRGVAVSKDSKYFVSVSEDRTACIWVKGQSFPKFAPLKHPDAVHSVVCSPAGSSHNWCVTGCADGNIYFWDLDHPTEKPVVREAHRGPVTALAFSPDGTYFASGGADNVIQVWRTGEEKPLYTVDDQAPAGPVTSLSFTPQARLVSASKDNTLRVWELHEKGAKLIGMPIAGRAGFVNQLGVSQDGRWMLFDQHKALQLLSVEDGRTTSILQGPAGATTFETVALFSPDGAVMLTAGPVDGRLQLWKTPTSFARGYQVCEFVTQEKGASSVTCAAFATDGALAVSGAKDGTVYLWSVPDKKTIDNQPIRDVPLTMIGQTVEGGTRQVRIAVQLKNSPERRLMDGRPATIVIEP